MKIAKVFRGKSAAGTSVNAVVAANIGEADAETIASSRQDVQIVQRSGHTEVRELDADDTEA